MGQKVGAAVPWLPVLIWTVINWTVITNLNPNPNLNTNNNNNNNNNSKRNTNPITLSLTVTKKPNTLTLTLTRFECPDFNHPDITGEFHSPDSDCPDIIRIPFHLTAVLQPVRYK